MSDRAKQFNSFEEAAEFIDEVGMTNSVPMLDATRGVWHIFMSVPGRCFTSDDFMIEDK